MRNWNIQDAKDGDVLVYQNGDTEIIMIFKSERDAFHAYTHFQVFNNTYEVNNSCVWCIGGHPATKEQCAFLFQKMKEAGYEWDADKKELKKIEKKPDEKAKPKFKVGAWIFSPTLGTAHIIDVRTIGTNTSDFLLEYTDGTQKYTSIKYVNYAFDKWTIQNTKNGDVLASNNGNIILVKESRDSSWGYRLSYHCAVLYDGTFEPREFHVDPKKFFPATKEQRELLFAKIKEYGYEWDSDNKELKKIEQKPLERSEDERIKKELLEYLQRCVKCNPLTEETEKIMKDSIAWLE